MAKITTTIDFGATPVTEGTFVITDASFAGLTYAQAEFMGSDTAIGTDTDAHKQAAYVINLIADAPVGNNITVTANCDMFVTGVFTIRVIAA